MRRAAPLLVLTDARCARHDAGAGHPERPERLRFAMDADYPDAQETLKRKARYIVLV